VSLFVVAILYLAGCGEVIPIATVPDAENSLITVDGRLFVTGSFNLYEITKDSDGAFVNHRVIEEDLYFGGIDEYKGRLYTLKSNPGLNILLKPDPSLVIADLQAMDPFAGPQPLDTLFTDIPLPDMSMPNGLVIDKKGHLYISDTLKGKIFRFDILDDDLSTLDGPFDTGLEGLGSPNGLAVDGDVLFFTDGGSVKKTMILDGGALGPAQTLFSGRFLLDDLTVYQGCPVVCDYVSGTVFQLSATGEIMRETKLETFAFPSSVNLAQGPLFTEGDILVTEKGVIYEPTSDFGNRIVLFEITEP